VALVNSCAVVSVTGSDAANSAVDSLAIESDCIVTDQCYAAVVVVGMMASLVSVCYTVMEALVTGFDSGKVLAWAIGSDHNCGCLVALASVEYRHWSSVVGKMALLVTEWIGLMRVAVVGTIAS